MKLLRFLLLVLTASAMLHAAVPQPAPEALATKPAPHSFWAEAVRQDGSVLKGWVTLRQNRLQQSTFNGKSIRADGRAQLAGYIIGYDSEENTTGLFQGDMRVSDLDGDPFGLKNHVVPTTRPEPQKRRADGYDSDEDQGAQQPRGGERQDVLVGHKGLQNPAGSQQPDALTQQPVVVVIPQPAAQKPLSFMGFVRKHSRKMQISGGALIIAAAVKIKVDYDKKPPVDAKGNVIPFFTYLNSELQLSSFDVQKVSSWMSLAGVGLVVIPGVAVFFN